MKPLLQKIDVLLLVLLLLSPSAYGLLPIGKEFKVNTHTQEDQYGSSIAMDQNSNYVISWKSCPIFGPSQDGFDCGAFAKRYDYNGMELIPASAIKGAGAGNEFQVNTWADGSQADPSIAMDVKGNFVVAWPSSPGQDGDSTGIFAQRFDSNGNPLGAEFQVNTFTAYEQYQPSAAMNHDGNFVIAWTSNFQDGSQGGVFAQLFDSSGNPIGSEFQANTYANGEQSKPAAAIGPQGNFVIVWEGIWHDPVADSYSWRIFARLFDNSGNPVGSEFQVNNNAEYHSHNPSAAMFTNGNFVVAWESFDDETGLDIFAQFHDHKGNEVGSEFKVNTYLDEWQQHPAVAVSQNGDAIIAWDSFGQDGSQEGIYGKGYDSAGKVIAPEFQVNSFTAFKQSDPHVAIATNSDFVVSWNSYSQDGSDWGVYAQKFNLRESIYESNKAQTEIHLKWAQTDSDKKFETVGIENADGTKGLLKVKAINPAAISQSAFGFTFDETGKVTEYAPAYKWATLEKPTKLSLGDDEVSSFIPLGFSTRFYGKGNSTALFDKIKISSNGFVTFADSANHGCCEGQNLLNPVAPNHLVAGWWEDLRPASGGGAGEIKYETLGTAPNRKFVVEFDNVGHYGDASKKVSFQIVFFEDN